MTTFTEEIPDGVPSGWILPVSDEARAALDSVCPEQGLVFGKHAYREHLAKAAKAVLPEEQAGLFTAYDFRRGALTTFGDTGDLTGVAFIADHKQLTTSSIYIRPERTSAERMLRQLDTKRSPGSAARAGVVAKKPANGRARRLRNLLGFLLCAKERN